jgi:aerobic C4-dicarboxylate transport protein
MSEARAVTNFAGNAIATVLIATWTRELDREQFDAALSGRLPFDEASMIDVHDEPASEPAQLAGTRGSAAEPVRA